MFKNIRLIYAFLLALQLTGCQEEIQFSEQEIMGPESDLINITPIKSILREDITFILGVDKKANNPYYSEAINYYAFNPAGKTKHLVTNCRSLQEVSEYLENYKPDNDLPWGLINLVSHGNQWMGLSAKVTPISKRATPERIQEFIDNKTLKPLSSQVLDDHSEIFVHGCGIGNNSKLLNLIATAFGGELNQPIVRASKLYEYYTSEKYGHAVKSTERYTAQSYSLSYKMGYAPSQQGLVRRFRNSFPGNSIDWQDALSRDKPRWPGDTYHFTFQVPVKWVIPFPDANSLPDVSTKSKQLAWIKTQPEIMDKLNGINLPAEKFNWWFRQVYVNNADGSKSPAIWLKGYCTILSVLQALTTENGNHLPLKPDLNDEHYYATSIDSGEKFKR